LIKTVRIAKTEGQYASIRSWSDSGLRVVAQNPSIEVCDELFAFGSVSGSVKEYHDMQILWVTLDENDKLVEIIND